MKRILFLTLFLAILAVPSFAAAYDPNGFNTSCSAATTTGACTGYSIATNGATAYSWQVTFNSGTATAVTVNFEWSIDGTNWWVADVSNTLTGEGRSVVNKSAHFLRCNVVTYTIGTTTNLTCGFAVAK